MSLYCTNPHVFQGEPGNPPEYMGDNEQPCSDCGYPIDLNDDPFLKMADGTILCSDCRELCPGCDQWITDYANVVRILSDDKKRMEPWHRDCVAGGRA